LERYGAASGARINIRKSKALAVGTWDTSINIMGINYEESVKILGIQFTNTIHQTTLNSWTMVTNGIRAQAQETYSRDLNLYQRFRYVHTFFLARAWFIAQTLPLPRGCERQST
jgi:purine nucleoside permease